ncbi:MAG TPA: hypothetical protein VFI25_15835 [Planctomycetota bacterium]|jgi:hypothetical protein|nr:hypothetical protein [Planctomycetota bacterium]
MREGAETPVNSNWIDLLRIFNAERVRYLVVGAHALAAHAEPRYTGDFDVWVEPTRENGVRVWKALAAFGAPMETVRLEDFARPDTVFQIGVSPNRVDVMTSISGVRFPTAWKNRFRAKLMGVAVTYVGFRELVRNKRASGRAKDRIDLEILADAARHRARTRHR